MTNGRDADEHCCSVQQGMPILTSRFCIRKISVLINYLNIQTSVDDVSVGDF